MRQTLQESKRAEFLTACERERLAMKQAIEASGSRQYSGVAKRLCRDAIPDMQGTVTRLAEEVLRLARQEPFVELKIKALLKGRAKWVAAFCDGVCGNLVKEALPLYRWIEEADEELAGVF